MEKLKIAIAITGSDDASRDMIRKTYEDSAVSELCTTVFYTEEDAALSDLDKGKADAVVIVGAAGQAKAPAGATEIIVTGKACIMPLAKEPDPEDIVRLRDIMERDFDLRSPRIAIVQETAMQNPELAAQVTAEQGINTYGPYTAEQIKGEDMATHFDGIITSADKAQAMHIAGELSQEASVCCFCGMEKVVTAACQLPAQDGTEDVSALTHPIYTAIDIIRNRSFYDEARRNILPKLFRDKRDERKKEEAAQANNKTDNTEKPS